MTKKCLMFVFDLFIVFILSVGLISCDDGYENKIFINAKYVDPKDKAVTVVFEDVAVRIVRVDSDGNEYINCSDSEDGSIKAINEVKREE